jgi:branched-subunit amino acid transport protein
MSPVTALASVLALGVATYALRGGLILLLADRTLPQLVERALRNVAPAVLAALVVTMLADPTQPAAGVEAAEVGGLVVAGLITWRWRNLMLALSGGMVTFWLLLGLS